MHAAKCVLYLNRNDLADSLAFDMNLKTNPTDMIQIGAYKKQSQTKESETSKKKFLKTVPYKEPKLEQ